MSGEVVIVSRPTPERAAWLLGPESIAGRRVITRGQYEELRAEAVALALRTGLI